MRIAVFGSTGGLGRELVTLALREGHTVRAHARSPEKVSLTDPALTWSAVTSATRTRSMKPSRVRRRCELHRPHEGAGSGDLWSRHERDPRGDEAGGHRTHRVDLGRRPRTRWRSIDHGSTSHHLRSQGRRKGRASGQAGGVGSAGPLRPRLHCRRVGRMVSSPARGGWSVDLHEMRGSPVVPYPDVAAFFLQELSRAEYLRNAPFLSGPLP